MGTYKNVALVTDSITQFGGGDRVLESLMKVFPEATIFTSFFNADAYPEIFKKRKIVPFLRSSNPISRFISGSARQFSFLYPYFFEQIDLREYDLVISFTAASAKGVITTLNTKHVSIIFTPPHFQFGNHRNLRGFKGEKLINQFITPITDQFLRIWDYNAAQRPDLIITISKYIESIVKDLYHRDSDIIYPPVNLKRFGKSKSRQSPQKEKFFLIVSRFFEFKRIDRAIEAANRTRINLKIVGRGPDEKYLKSIAGNTVEFLGEISDQEVNDYILNCEAQIFPGVDDFGIAPVEAQAAGKPVIAYHKGGALETIVKGKTGEFFRDTTEKGEAPALDEILVKFNPKKYNPKECIKNAERFSEEKFIAEIKKYIEKI